MPVLVPSGIYSTGRFQVDLSPIDQVIKQREAEKKAASDAASKYLASMQEKVNTVGVRDIDRVGDKGIDAQMQQWVNYGTSNLGKISKGGAEQAEFLKMYRGILSNIEKSKNRANTIKEIGKLKVEGKYDPDDDDLGVLDKMGKPIYDEESYKPDGSEYGWADLPTNAPEFDPARQDRFFKSVEGGAKVTYDEKNARQDELTGKIYIPTGYNDEDIKMMASNAYNVLPGDRSARKHYKKLLSDGDWLARAQTEYQSIFGNDQKVDTPEKAAAADTIMRARLAGGEKEVVDPAFTQKLKKQMEDYRQKLRKEIISIQDRNATNRMREKEQYINQRAAARKASGGGSDDPITYGEYYGTKAKDGKVYVQDIDKQDYNFVSRDFKVLPKRNQNDQLYYDVKKDGNWEGSNGTIDKTRVLNVPIKDLKGTKRKHSSNINAENAPGSDVAISQYPENIQRGIVAFSQQNNLPLSDALEVLKQNRPDIFA